MNVNVNFKPAEACHGLLCWFDAHEGTATWFGAFASLLVTAVALWVPFITLKLERQRELQKKGLSAVVATRHALSALRVLGGLQAELYEISRTPIGGTIGRDWLFDLRTADRVLGEITKHELADVGLTERVTMVHLWVIDAIELVPRVGGTDEDRRARASAGLRKLQESMVLRAGVHDLLMAYRPRYTKVATRWWPKALRRRAINALKAKGTARKKA